jgi:uncharacterized membrane protein
MAFCARCGAQVTGAFCPQCGAPASGTAAGGSPPPPPPGAAASTSSGLEEHVAATLCYVTIIPPILFLLISPYNQNKTIRFHAFQSIFFIAAYVVLQLGLTVVSVMIAMVDLGFLSMLFGFASWLIMLAVFGLWVYLLIQTYQKKKVVLPVIGPLAAKQA